MEIEITKENIRKYREALGMTQEQLAHDLGVSWTTVSRWENQGRGMKRGLTRYALQRYFTDALKIN